MLSGPVAQEHRSHRSHTVSFWSGAVESAVVSPHANGAAYGNRKGVSLRQGQLSDTVGTEAAVVLSPPIKAATRNVRW
jgi:hypothetical protein